MKFQFKRILTVALTVALVLGIGYFSWDGQLRASDSEGTVTAAQQQEQAENTDTPVQVIISDTEEIIVIDPAAQDVVEEPVVEEPAAAPVAVDPFQNASVYVWLRNKGDLYFGDEAHLEATVRGVEDGAAYSLQWQTDKGKGWENIPGATGSSYDFVMTQSNVTLPYRAVLICD